MMMQRISGIISTVNFGLAILAAILLIFDSFVGVPEYLKIAGRMHPLMLHLPIGMFVMYLVLYVIRKSFDGPDLQKILSFVLTLTAFFAFLTAISGSLLSHEPDAYDISQLAIHRNTGFGFAFGVYLLSIINGKYPTFSKVLIGINTLLIIVAGHKGAEITHGKDFLFPKKEIKEILSDSNTTLFTAMVHPILEKKCYSCHNPEKTKGGFIMTDTIYLMKGGESGRVIVPGNADSSLLVQSLLLPMEDEKHMPPDGKPQLTTDEQEIIIAWINSGASFSKKVGDYTSETPIRKLYEKNFTSKSEKNYEFPKVDAETLQSLNTHSMSVAPLYAGSSALKASIFLAAAYTPEYIKNLLKVKANLVQLNLVDMPVTDKDIENIVQLVSLEKLVLNGTKISDQGVQQLIKLTHLEELSLVNTEATKAIEPIFAKMPSLKQVYLSDTKITQETADNWRQKFPKVTFNMLSIADLKMKLSPPLIVNESFIIKTGEEIHLKHYIKGAEIRYTTDGSEPDSIHGTLYTKPFTISGSTDVKAVAVKDGWFVSDVVKFSLFENGATPDRCILLTQANVQYKGEGALTLINGKRAPINNLPDPNWIAFRENPFSALFEYDAPIALSKISFCYGLQVPQYVFPPLAVSVSGSNDKKDFQLLTTQKITPFNKANKEQVRADVIHMALKNQPYKYYKIEAQNLPRIPDWHPGKGERGWLFIDEIFFYDK